MLRSVLHLVVWTAALIIKMAEQDMLSRGFCHDGLMFPSQLVYADGSAADCHSDFCAMLMRNQSI